MLSYCMATPVIGQIYWLVSASGVKHPHVVIEVKDKDVVVCEITSNLQKAHLPGNVFLDANEANLEKDSVVEVSKQSTTDVSDLGEFVGELSATRMEEISAGIKFVTKSFFAGDSAVH